MGWNTITIRPSDKLFSNYIREKAGWKCQRCGKLCKVNDEWIGKLEASHYFSRGHENTRFDEQNVWALCAGCHKRMGGYIPSEGGEYDLWVKEKLGDWNYKRLKIRANTYRKKDEKLALIYVKQLIKQNGK
jgi:5-methylcytosine-specific restriction endonuclease McrA